jgi:hypothetical protein
VDGLNFLRVRISRGLSLDHRPPSVKVEKPWGYFEQYTHNLPCTVKVITVSAGGTLSRQYHHKRDELWVVLDRGACVELGKSCGGDFCPSPRWEGDNRSRLSVSPGAKRATSERETTGAHIS